MVSEQDHPVFHDLSFWNHSCRALIIFLLLELDSAFLHCYIARFLLFLLWSLTPWQSKEADHQLSNLMIRCSYIHLTILVKSWWLEHSMEMISICGRELSWELYPPRIRLVSLMAQQHNLRVIHLSCLIGNDAMI